MGGGVAFAFLPDSAAFELGTRLDLFASYFDMSHLSEDDIAPERRSRWQTSGDVVAEGGWRITRNAGSFLGAGIEAIRGRLLAPPQLFCAPAATHALISARSAAGILGFPLGIAPLDNSDTTCDVFDLTLA